MKPAHIMLGILMGTAVLCLFVMAYLWSTLPVEAHSWYDTACCSDRDCEAIEPDAVTETKLGYKVDYFSRQGFEVHGWIERTQTRHSHDGRFHGCATSTRFLCLYVPSVS